MENLRDNLQSANVEAYLGDIKELLEKHYGEHAVYHDGKRVAIEKDVLAAQHYVYEYNLEKSGEPILIRHIIPLTKEQVEELRTTGDVKVNKLKIH